MLGISPLAQTAYRMLLIDPSPQQAKLREAMGGEADGALAELISRGLVAPHPAGEGMLRVEPPERAVEILVQHEEAALEARRAALAGLRDGIGEMVAEFVSGRTRVLGDVIEEVAGDDAVRSRLYQIATGAKREVLTCNPGPAPSRRVIEASRAMDALARKRGVRSRAVFATEAVTDEAMHAYLAEVVEAGDEVRLHPAPPVLLFIVDSAVAVVPADTDKHSRAALVLHSRALIEPLLALHRQLWLSALPFDPAGRPLDAEEERLRRIAAVLAEGHKDETVARRLGLSVRTVRRLISQATERLAAESRFQAGVHAVRRGWVPR